ncbi:hypothetical protein [Lentibacillus sp. JNUCC-1]|uniref:hypothetical protein n=1 Tax=Lentibacillus sp. JNUCC-1 TaxID=2654513 RepID=UPI0018D228C6|nr:hypothetical protein [Lentibacillus sp. JNUCC-1]
MISYYKEERFTFDKLIKKHPIDELNQALEDMKSGKTIKPVFLSYNNSDIIMQKNIMVPCLEYGAMIILPFEVSYSLFIRCLFSW